MSYPSDKKSRTKIITNLLTGANMTVDNEPLEGVRESKYVGHEIGIARDN
jgi:hypothetical protein